MSSIQAMYPILEFDPERSAILNPTHFQNNQPISSKAVLCFFQEVLLAHVTSGRLKKVGGLNSEMGENPIYELEQSGQHLTVFHPGVGAPLAAGFLDELIVGEQVKTVVVCGGCGVLQVHIAAGHPVILTSAVRDEGTSYHYLAPSREVASSPRVTAALEAACLAHGMEYLLGKTWTTDGLYRETPAKRAVRLAEGCSVVEMEAAAFFAVAQFRGAEIGQIVYGGDLVVPDGWDRRGWNSRLRDRELIFDLAVEAALSL